MAEIMEKCYPYTHFNLVIVNTDQIFKIAEDKMDLSFFNRTPSG
jgi:hypothetical protein